MKRFRNIRPIGSGGFGRVFIASTLEGRTVAIKELNPASGRGMNNIEAEIEFHRTLSGHANIVRFEEVFFAGENPQKAYIVMEYCDCGDLKDFISKKDRLEAEEIRDIFRQIAAAVGECHAKGIVHMDIKPDNIFVSSDGTVKLGDFGLARSVHSREKVRAFTPTFAAPEILNETCDPEFSSDIYSLGCVLYELLTGLNLFDGDDSEDVEEILDIAQHRVLEIPSYLAAAKVPLFEMVVQMTLWDRHMRPSVEELLSWLTVRAGAHTDCRTLTYEDETIAKNFAAMFLIPRRHSRFKKRPSESFYNQRDQWIFRKSQGWRRVQLYGKMNQR